MKELTPKEAIKILHPDTSRDALWKIEYYAGFNAEKARVLQEKQLSIHQAIEIVKEEGGLNE